MSETRPANAARALLSPFPLTLLATLLACAGGEPAGSSDGPIDDRSLQEIVTLQGARDARGLVQLLEDDRAAVRARAAFALGSVQLQGAAGSLLPLLSDESPAVRAEAAFALGQLPQSSDDIESGLIAAAESESDPAARLRMIEALGKVGRESASEWLARLPTTDAVGPDGTLALARTLARGVATRASTDALLARLVDPDAAVREMAAWGLASSLIESTWASERERVYQALDGYDRSDPAAAQLLRALLRLADPAARERMRGWLRDSPDWRVRAAAVEGLTAASAPADRAALLAALDDSSAHVRRAAAGALLGAPLEPAELDRIQRWIEAHRDDFVVGAALMKTLVARERGAYAVGWVRSLPADQTAAWVLALDAIALVSGDGALGTLSTASASPSPVVSGAAARALAYRWAAGRGAEGADPAQARLYYDAFARALRDRDPGLAPVLPDLLSEAPFRALGSEELLAEARTLAAAPPAPVVAPDWNALRGLGERPRLVLETERGSVTIELFPDEAPLTVQTVARVAGEGRYDGVPFHRVIPNFMAQGGDVARGDGLGEVGFRVPSEFTHLRYTAGTVGMARVDKDSEGSQFFLTQSLQPHLDGAYTAFGRVVDGMDAVDALIEGDLIVRARVEPDAPAGTTAR